jgi:thioredoxin 1
MSSNENIDKVTYVTKLDEIPKTGLVVIDVYADWCGPCKKLGPVFNELSGNNKYANITFLKANSDDAENLCKYYEVSALPTVIFLKDNDVVSIIKGFNLNVLISELNEMAK